MEKNAKTICSRINRLLLITMVLFLFSGCSIKSTTDFFSSDIISTNLPGKISVIDYMSAFDKDAVNSGNCGRSGPVDFNLTDEINGVTCSVSNTQAGEWITYIIETRESQKMDVDFHVSTHKDRQAFKIQLDNETIGIVTISGNSLNSWQTVSLKALDIPAGEHEIKIIWLTGNINLQFFEFSLHKPFGKDSALWGASGHKYDPSGYLTDWSYAGYHWGEGNPPVKKTTINVLDYGAIPNDDSDDSTSFVNALAAAEYGDVIGIPAGRFILTQVLKIPNGVVLKGQGSEFTTIEIPTDINKVTGISPSFTGGFIEMIGSTNSNRLRLNITKISQRGSYQIFVDNTNELKVGEWIKVQQHDRGGNLLLEVMYEGFTEGLYDYTDLLNKANTKFFSRISRLDKNVIYLERPLPFTISPEYSAKVYDVDIPYGEVGLEGITIKFPETDYSGHLNETGYNAIDMQAQHSWIRDVVVKNIDYGINIRRSHFVSVLDFRVINSNMRSGHHGIHLALSTDCLIRGFDIQAELVHDISVNWFSHSNVFTQGRGDNLTLDHHRAAANSNLFSQIHLGKGMRPWVSGGRRDRGYNAGVYNTYWNLTSEQRIELPPENFAPKMVFVGVPISEEATSKSKLDWWIESIDPDQIYPPNIWLSQKEKRFNGYSN